MKNNRLMLALVTLFCVFQAAAMEKSYVGPKADVLNSKLTKAQQKKLREAIMGMRPLLMKQHNGEMLSQEEQTMLGKQEAVVNDFTKKYAQDSFVIEKLSNHRKFLRKLEKSKQADVARLLAESKIVSTDCCICMDDGLTMPVPCERLHAERICQSCLDDLAARTTEEYPNGQCPICRGKLEAKK